MTCLICLRNEGVYFSGESAKFWEIFVQLFSLPQQLSNHLKGNPCCSKCRVKLQIIEVITNEIGLLKDKWKYVENGMKDSFVNSFQESEEPSEPLDEISIQLRISLLNKICGEFPSQTHCQVPAPPSRPQSRNAVREIETKRSSLDILDSQAILSSNISIEPHVVLESQLSEMNLTLNQTFLPDQTIAESEFDHEELEGYYADEYEAPDFNSTQFVEQSMIETDEPVSSDGTSNHAHFKKIKLEKLSTPLKKPQRRMMSPSKVNKIRDKRKSRAYICRACPEKGKYSTNDEYENHVKVIHPNIHYSKCPTCSRIILEKSQNSGNNLKCHMKIHEERQFKCPKCALAFHRKIHLDHHLDVHELTREVFICEVCSSTTVGQLNYDQHMKRYHGKRNYNCKQCGFNTCEASTYANHREKCN